MSHNKIADIFFFICIFNCFQLITNHTQIIILFLSLLQCTKDIKWMLLFFYEKEIPIRFFLINQCAHCQSESKHIWQEKCNSEFEMCACHSFSFSAFQNELLASTTHLLRHVYLDSWSLQSRSVELRFTFYWMCCCRYCRWRCECECVTRKSWNARIYVYSTRKKNQPKSISMITWCRYEFSIVHAQTIKPQLQASDYKYIHWLHGIHTYRQTDTLLHLVLSECCCFFSFSLRFVYLFGFSFEFF